MPRLTEYPFLAVHSQSNRVEDAPLDFNDPSEQAFDSRALMLPDVGVLAVTKPIEPAYAAYYTQILGLTLPEVISPAPAQDGSARPLAQSLLDYKEAFA